jgi:hypothetical protein
MGIKNSSKAIFLKIFMTIHHLNCNNERKMLRANILYRTQNQEIARK